MKQLNKLKDINRKEEILVACDQLYNLYGYEGINLKAISKSTTFTRTLIYKYYNTKEEIMLDLLLREVSLWTSSLSTTINTTSRMTKEQYSNFLTNSLESHQKMLHLFAILFTILEKNSSVEKLTEFRIKLGKSLSTSVLGIDKFFPSAPEREKRLFGSSFFAFILGLYPMCHFSEKQHESGNEIETHPKLDFRIICSNGILLLLSKL